MSRATESLPKQFHSQGDKNAEIARLESLISTWEGSARPDRKAIKLAKQRLRVAKGLGVRA